MSCDPHDSWKYIIGITLWQGLEHWLGKTDKVEAASTPALIFNAVEWTLVSLYQKLFKR